MVVDLGQGVEAVFGQHHFVPPWRRKISALRRMVLLSSMTSTLAPAGAAAPWSGP
jgi:hypothetical protein